MINSALPIHWISHDKSYYRKLMVLTGTAMPMMSAGLASSMDTCIQDLKANRKKHTLPTLVLTGGKDKVVDNVGAREFYKHINTPADKKQLKLFYNAYHQIHKEPQYKTQFYQTIYEFVGKTLNQSKANPSSLNFGGITTFKVGRPVKRGAPPMKRFLALGLVGIYLLAGLALWILLKIFSKNRGKYSFKQVVFLWPRAFRALLDALKSQGGAVAKMVNQY